MCNGGNDGSATASATGGAAPYTYAWSNGSSDATAINLSAGNHSVTITDDNQTSISTTVDITEPEALVTTKEITNEVCMDGFDGSIMVEVNGGVAPYNYSWSNGGTESVLEDLTAGNVNRGDRVIQRIVTGPIPLLFWRLHR